MSESSWVGCDCPLSASFLCTLSKSNCSRCFLSNVGHLFWMGVRQERGDAFNDLAGDPSKYFHDRWETLQLGCAHRVGRGCG